MLNLDNRKMDIPFFLQLIFVFLVSLVVMIILRDARIPLDGSSYAASVLGFEKGNLGDVFRWSHLLHVPALFWGYRLFGPILGVDVLTYYQGLDIFLGSWGLSLLYLLLYRVSQNIGASLAGCLLVMFSWVYWIESVTADEKLLGFFFVLIYLNVLEYFLGGAAQGKRIRTGYQAVILALFLSLSILMHASAVLVLPVSVFLVLRQRNFRLGILTTLISLGLVLGSYALVLNMLDVRSWAEVTAFFSSGVSSYSVTATGLSGMAWVRSSVQGLTKLMWAVFSEDGMKAGLFFAGLNFILIFGVLMVMWRHRRDHRVHGFVVLYFTALVFGLTYAPDSPDSYFLMIVPTAVFFALAWKTKPLCYAAVAMLLLLGANNGAHYVGFSAFKDNGADRQYQAAIREKLPPGGSLVILDSVQGMATGTQTIAPLHGYFNPAVDHILSSEFFSDPAHGRYLSLAREGRLYIEGLCFETYENRSRGEIQDNLSFIKLLETYDLVPITDFSEYSSLFHRAYKYIYQATPKSVS